MHLTSRYTIDLVLEENFVRQDLDMILLGHHVHMVVYIIVKAFLLINEN